jgi:hypothetical protein
MLGEKRWLGQSGDDGGNTAAARCGARVGSAQRNPTRGGARGSCFFDIQEGQFYGVDLRGGKVVFRADWPADFFSGNGIARLYLDESASQEQRAELEGIFAGRRGGHLEAVWQGTISEWLASEVTRIQLDDGEAPSMRIGDVGDVQYQAPVQDPTGRATAVQDAAAATAFALGTVNLTRSDGSRWSGPDMREWESGGSGTSGTFAWSS